MARGSWASKLLLLASIVLLGWAAYVSWKQFERHTRIRDEVEKLEEEAARIRKENETLSERIGYFSSQEFREQEAKKKLGLKKPDETVVALKEERAVAGEAAKEGMPPALAPDRPAYRKWWDIFFSQR